MDSLALSEEGNKLLNTALAIKVTLIGLNFASRSQRFQKFRVGLISRMSLKTAEKAIFGHKYRVLTSFSTQNAIFKKITRI